GGRLEKAALGRQSREQRAVARVGFEAVDAAVAATGELAPYPAPTEKTAEPVPVVGQHARQARVETLEHAPALRAREQVHLGRRMLGQDRAQRGRDHDQVAGAADADCQYALDTHAGGPRSQSSRCAKWRSSSKRSSAAALPAAARRARRRRSHARRSSASASATGSPGGTSRPVRSCSMISGTPPASVPITATPARMASISTSPKVSL